MNIDCQWQIVNLQTLREEDMMFKGSRLIMMLGIISALKAKWDLAGAAEAYLVQVALKSREPKKVLGIPIVEEFQEVFTDDLPRLPPF